MSTAVPRLSILRNSSGTMRRDGSRANIAKLVLLARAQRRSRHSPQSAAAHRQNENPWSEALGIRA